MHISFEIQNFISLISIELGSIMIIDEGYNLQWNNFEANAASSLGSLRSNGELLDITLVSQDEAHHQAHKVVLAAASPFFRKLMSSMPHKHPFLYLSYVSSSDLELILDYIYKGETTVRQDNLDDFLEKARMLKIQGLLDTSSDDVENDVSEVEHELAPSQNDLPQAQAPLVNTPSLHELSKPTFENIPFRDESQESFENVKVEMEFKPELLALRSVHSDEATTTPLRTREKRKRLEGDRIDVSHLAKQEIAAKIESLIEVDGKNYACKICRNTKKHKGHMTYHIECHLEGLSYSCPTCGETFKSRIDLTTHKYKVHKGQRSS